MQRLYTPTDAANLADAAMREVILRRFLELTTYDDFTFDELAEFWLVQAGETIAQVETVTGMPVSHGWCSAARYPDPDFVPAWEVLEAHASCFEMVFVTNDSGYGVVLWIPKEGADPVLLAMCAQHATPAPAETLTTS